VLLGNGVRVEWWVRTEYDGL